MFFRHVELSELFESDDISYLAISCCHTSSAVAFCLRSLRPLVVPFGLLGELDGVPPEVPIEDCVVVESPLEPVLLVLDRPLPLLYSLAVKILPSETGLATKLLIDLPRLEFHLTRRLTSSVPTILSYTR